jgi:hypothetical protein
METPSLPDENPLTTADKKQEDKFEKAMASPDKPSLFNLSVYARTFLGGLLLLAMFLFYISHISGRNSLGTYGQSPTPAVDSRAPNQ